MTANNPEEATTTTTTNADVQEGDSDNSNNIDQLIKEESMTDMDNNNNNNDQLEIQQEKKSDNNNSKENDDDNLAKEKITTILEKDDTSTTQSNVNANVSEINTSHDGESLAQDSNITQSTPVVPKESLCHPQHLIYNDIVLEFKDLPSERFLFPKEAILEVLPSETSPSLKASFLLPIDPTTADHFFWDAKKKIKYFGEHSAIPIIQEKAKDFQTETKGDDNGQSKEQTQYQPVNIRILDATNETITALTSSIYNADYVRSKMIEKMKVVPTRKYLDFKISEDEQEAIHELIQRIHTVPDIVSGPIAAEKKRNEISLAIKLGKRPASDQHEAEPPKTKQNQIGKEDGLRKCIYCSTRHTTMWRQGPAGGGTLCNGCGILWQQGKILVGATMISKEEEKQKIKKKWERDYYQRQQLEWELERKRIREEKELTLKKEHEAQLRLEACLRQKRAIALYQQQHHHLLHRNNNNKNNSNNSNKNDDELLHDPSSENQPSLPTSSSIPTNTHSDNHQPISIDMNANNDALQNQNAQDSQPISSTSQVPTTKTTDKDNTQQTNKSSKSSTKASKKGAKENKAAKSTTAATTTTTTTNNNNNNNNSNNTQTTSAATTTAGSSSSYHIFNLPLIPLPTLCIEFADTMFSHPHCTASISQQKHFTIHLNKDDTNITINIPKSALTNSKFEILGQIDSAGRDILLMSCQPNDVGFGINQPLEAFGTILYDPQDDQHKQLNVRFLEKIDSFGGPVVKKILECWLAGVNNLNS
ncbi:unnamed protein product [Cunninghamella echinulata]